MTNDHSPASLEMQLQRLTRQVLSPRSRYGHVALLLAALIMCTLIAALLVTETGLPGRTQAALAAMLGIGACWAGYAVWVLAYRRTLLANHRVVAGWMAVGFTAMFFAGASGLAWMTGIAAFLTAAGMGTVMLAAAIVLLVRARRHVDRLRAQRRELERQLDAQAS